MRNKIFSVLYLLFLLFNIVDPFSGNDLKVLFGQRICIQGSILDLPSMSQDLATLKVKETNNVHNITDLSLNDIEKSSLSRVHELAQFNEVKYYYELENEEGPAHSKLFTVKLMLGDEEYRGQGTSLKRAQRSAAVVALEKTEFQHPPIKIKNNENNNLTPTVLLNNLAAKLGVSVKYSLVTDDIETKVKSKTVDERSKKSYLQKLNDSIDSTIKVRKDEPGLKGPFKVKVNVDDKVFFGEARTIQDARHEAASNALKGLKKSKEDGNFDCLKEGNEKKCKEAKERLKSPISLVYEAAQKGKLDVSFEVVDETGPAHKKTFVTMCRLGDLTTTGEGRSKKDSKRAAAEQMVERFSELPEASESNGSFEIKNKKKKKKKNKIIKSNFDKIDMMLDSVMDFGSDVIKKITNKEDKSDTKPTKKTARNNSKPPSQNILELSNLLKFEAQFTDFSDDGKTHYSVLSMDLKPSFICFGEGLTEKTSRDKAANGAINLLYKLGLILDNFGEKLQSESLDDTQENKVWFDITEDKDEL